MNGRPRKQFSEVWDGKVFYGGRWTPLATVEHIRRRQAVRDRKRREAKHGS